MYLDNTLITKLPEQLTINGYLRLENTPITKLPDMLVVSESLYLDNTKISILPNYLSVGEDLCLSNTLITHLPDNLSVGCMLYLDAEKIKNIAFRKLCGKDKCTIFAAFINGEIQINKKGSLSNIETFELEMDKYYSATEAEKYKQAARECVKELIQMRNNN